MVRAAEFMNAVVEALESGEPVAVAVVTNTRGAAPRSSGAGMAFTRAGRLCGTVGGGFAEMKTQEAAMEVLRTGKPLVVAVDLTAEVTATSEAPCGGFMEILVVPWGLENAAFARSLAEAASSRGDKVVLLTFLEPVEFLGGMVALTGGSLAAVGLPSSVAEEAAQVVGSLERVRGGRVGRAGFESGGRRLAFLYEEISAPPRLIMCGGGHIALPLSRIASILGFDVTVTDERSEFAARERFPWAEQVLCGPFEETLAELPADEETCIVIATHGHARDVACLRQVIGKGAAYVGMVSSRRRAEGVVRLLQEEGVARGYPGELHSPAGLDIGAETPEEIALSIASEMTMVLKGGDGRPLMEPRC